MIREPFAEPENRGPITLQDYNRDLHIAMKARAKRRKVSIVLLYEQAVEEFLNRTAPKIKKNSLAIEKTPGLQ